MAELEYTPDKIQHTMATYTNESPFLQGTEGRPGRSHRPIPFVVISDGETRTRSWFVMGGDKLIKPDSHNSPSIPLLRRCRLGLRGRNEHCARIHSGEINAVYSWVCRGFGG
jgi:hypothetical protein